MLKKIVLALYIGFFLCFGSSMAFAAYQWPNLSKPGLLVRLQYSLNLSDVQYRKLVTTHRKFVRDQRKINKSYKQAHSKLIYLVTKSDRFSSSVTDYKNRLKRIKSDLLDREYRYINDVKSILDKQQFKQFLMWQQCIGDSCVLPEALQGQIAGLEESNTKIG